MPDHNEQALAYVYFEDEPGRRSAANLTDCTVWRPDDRCVFVRSTANGKIRIPPSIYRHVQCFAAIQSRSGHKHWALTVCQYWSPLAAPGNGAAFLFDYRGLAVACRLVGEIKGAGEKPARLIYTAFIPGGTLGGCPILCKMQP
jgi:hypothetical protein